MHDDTNTTADSGYSRVEERYPFTILDADGEVVDRAGNVETVESILYGDLSTRDGRPWRVVAPAGAVRRLEAIAAENADCWDMPLDTIEPTPPVEPLYGLERLGADLLDLYREWTEDDEEEGELGNAGSAADQCSDLYALLVRHGLPVA